MYRSITNRYVNPTNLPAGHKRVKDRLTKVLTVFADGTKGQLVVIGPSKYHPTKQAHLKLWMTQLEGILERSLGGLL